MYYLYPKTIKKTKFKLRINEIKPQRIQVDIFESILTENISKMFHLKRGRKQLKFD